MSSWRMWPTTCSTPIPITSRAATWCASAAWATAIDVTKPQGSRITDMTLLKTGRADRPGQDLCRGRLGQRQRRHRRPADLGCGRKPTSASKGTVTHRAEHNPCKVVDTVKTEGADHVRDSETPSPPRLPGRRRRRGAGAVAAGTARAAAADPLITEVQPWASGFGDGVDATPYGMPIELRSRCRAPQCRMADRRHDFLDQLHADPRARRHHHAAGLCVRAAPFRVPIELPSRTTG